MIEDRQEWRGILGKNTKTARFEIKLKLKNQTKREQQKDDHNRINSFRENSEKTILMKNDSK